MNLLSEILSINSVSGQETEFSQFLVEYICKRKTRWKVLPEIFFGNDFHDCILLRFGSPRSAVFAHIDTVGFMVRYDNQLIEIGGPEVSTGFKLSGRDRWGEISCNLIEIDDTIFHDFPRKIERGTCLSFDQNIRHDKDFLQAAYLDNRLGVYNALKLCEELEDGWVIFSTYEEHGGGSMPFLIDFIQKTAPVKQALISDVTWISDGVHHHEGVVVSIRDKFIPRKKFLDQIISLLEQINLPFQLEVEASGSSDGREIQLSPYFIDWCFIGPPVDQIHSPNERVSLIDLDAMIQIYKYLMRKL